ncbi:MAG: thiamine phosphate synthase [Cyclobacteriaceae bacterium]
MRELKGLYLVVDPAIEEISLLSAVASSVKHGAGIVQLWNHWQDQENKRKLIDKLYAICRSADVPMLINNDWEVLLDTQLDGVHFDVIPDDIEAIQRQVGRPFIKGITCGNDLEVVRKAVALDFDYLSFCAVFPTPTAIDCEIVDHAVITQAREIFKKPIFVSGGIHPANIDQLSNLDIDGVAVVSGILRASDPGMVTNRYIEALERIIPDMMDNRHDAHL